MEQSRKVSSSLTVTIRFSEPECASRKLVSHVAAENQLRFCFAEANSGILLVGSGVSEDFKPPARKAVIANEVAQINRTWLDLAERRAASRAFHPSIELPWNLD